MKTTTSFKLTVCAKILMASFLLSAYDCPQDGPTEPPQIQGCNTTYDSNWPGSLLGSLSLGKSTYCPIYLTGSPTVPYAATASLSPSTFSYGAYQVIVTTWNGYNGGFVADPVWSTGSDGKYIVSITGDYNANTGGFDSNDQGYDDVRNGFYLGSGLWTYATTRIPYYFGTPSNDVVTPDHPSPHISYTASATTHDVLMVDPVSWSLYVDGTFIKTTTSPQTSLVAGDAYQVQTVQVTASDSYGNSASGTTSYQVSCGTSNCGQ